MQSQRCQAITQRLNREGEPEQHGKQCKHLTSRGIYCWQHENTLRHFRITKTNTPPRSHYGLLTTQAIPSGKLICRYDGKKVVIPDFKLETMKNPYLLQINKQPPTFIDASNINVKEEGRWIKTVNKTLANSEIVIDGTKAYIYSIKDIPRDSEILLSRTVQHTRKPIIPVRRVKKVVSNETKQERIDQRYERKILIRLQFINDLFNDSKLAQKLRLKHIPNRILKIPKRGHLDFIGYRRKLEDLLKSQEKALFNYFKSQPNSNFTLKKVKETIDTLIDKKKPKLRKF